MSVNSNKSNNGNNNNNQANAQTPMGAAFSAAFSGAEVPKQSGISFSLGSLGNLIENPLSRTPEGEVLSATMVAFGKVLDGISNKQFKVEALPIDMANSMAVRISAIVLTLAIPGIDAIGFHTVILDGSIEKPVPVVQIVNNQNVQVLKLASDYNDQKMLAEVQAMLRAKYGCPLYNADASVLDRDLSLTDEKAVKAFIANALAACTTELTDRSGNSPHLNLAHESREVNVSLRRLFDMQEQTLDVNQHPIRSDIQLAMSVSPKDNTQAARSTEIARANCYVDLAYINSGDTASINAFYNPMQQMPKFYRPRLVITSLECTKLNTIAAQLLAVLQLSTIADNSSWARAFTNAGKVAERDFGAIGLEVPTRNLDGTMSTKRIDTREANFKTENLYRFISDTVDNNPLFTLHVPDCSPTTWMNRVFADAANGSADATAAIITGANLLTNNAFNKYFNDSVIGIHENNRIINGYYFDEKGRKRDIRDIDYLATLNYTGERDLSVIRTWSDSQYDYAPLEKRVSDRMGIIRGILGDQVVFTGYSTPVTLNPHFVAALVKGAAECGLSWAIQDNSQDITTMQRSHGQFDARFNVDTQFGASLNRGASGNGYAGGNNNFGNGFRF